mmetsp:Transcript_20749/g.18391  ORF Transcript_20749/g.18391 Transcript_20749/m.18391 type:complete len:239 (+) Transcript_20749:67-783(+)|eukprot:CAMPEP_0205805632 /NCGR_PEP_ID=MMETSP0205-20121125/8923_1 /ASSEMBLY_ACC=CAM_ASM_000278 /TAXON_ID=36767 /ORGANISM="Euplotes focardii, Strain TN1" /LENGTH=238 /DNA_ID=CAMNT_0053077179 /DNA_START=38 /DNA_END=750 /DNA_ORIENTATION=+
MPISERLLRNGLVATVVAIANVLDKSESEYVQEELKRNDKWINFAYTVLKESNERNERALAGHQSKGTDSDDETANYETSMDKLFAVFTNLKDSHDSSRNESDSDEEEADTDNILKDIETSSEGSEKSAPSAEEVKEMEEDKDTSEQQLQSQATAGEPKEETKTNEGVSKEPQNTQVESGEPAGVGKASNGQKESTTSEAVLETEDQLDSTVESNTFYDNSYWSVPSHLNLAEMLLDA